MTGLMLFCGIRYEYYTEQTACQTKSSKALLYLNLAITLLRQEPNLLFDVVRDGVVE